MIEYFCHACSHAWDLHRDVCAACLGREQVCRQRPVRMVSAKALAEFAPSIREIVEVGRVVPVAGPASQATDGQQVIMRGVFRR